LRANHYDLVVADVGLPDGSGHDVASFASAVGTKTVLITGHPDPCVAIANAPAIGRRKKLRH
jgi:FixJ family two-component response regulator